MPEVSDDGWGPERRVASRSAAPAPQAKPVRQMPPPHAQAPRRVQPAQPGPAPRGEHAPPLSVPYRDAGRQVPPVIGDARPRTRRASSVPQRGLVGWVAVALLVVVAGLGGLIDAVGGSTLKGVFAIGLIVGSLAAILLVRHRDMFPVVIAPPLIYFGASAVLLYFRSGGFKDRGVLIDAVSNWLVYGFPAIAGASAVVLIVAGGRLILNK